jgi:hypothetical protein
MTSISELTERQQKFFDDCDLAKPLEIVDWRDSRGTGKTWAMLEQVYRLCSGVSAVRGILIGEYARFEEETARHLAKFKFLATRRQLKFFNGSIVDVMERSAWQRKTQGFMADWVAFDLGSNVGLSHEEIGNVRHLLRNSECGKIMIVGL